MSQDDASTVDLDGVPLLIEAAFDAARLKGKSEWRRMTTAVLNNRLLQMTDRRLDLGALGFSSLADLLTQFPDLVRLDHTTRPTTVEFLGEASSRPRDAGPRSRRLRVRDDLWNAALNYSAGHAWVWDAASGEARPADDGDRGLPVMPTMSRDEMTNLRGAFASETALSLNEHDRERLIRWQTQGLGTAALPDPVQGRWNEYVKSNVVARLIAWFEAHGIDTPDDLVRADTRIVPQQIDEELARLRALVIDCVRSMTLSELASLDLPAGAVLRAQAQGASRRHGI